MEYRPDAAKFQRQRKVSRDRFRPIHPIG